MKTNMKNEMAEYEDIPGQSGDSRTPKPSPQLFSEVQQKINQQLLTMLTLVNVLLLGSILALFLKLAWLALITLVSVIS